METVVSGIRPTGNLHLGNYFGAVKNFLKMQDEYKCFFFIADWHSLTTHPHPGNVVENVRKILAEYLACGLNPEKATIYVQSDIKEIAELYLYLNMNAYLGELERTTTFKEKARKQPDNVNAGLLTYPTLMAADIIIHRARRFNTIYGSELFPEPASFSYTGEGIKIPGLDGSGKMGKSEGNAIYLVDDAATIRKKVMKAVTDSGPTEPNSVKPEVIQNLFTLMDVVSSKDTYDYFNEKYNNCEIRYGDLKKQLAEDIINFCSPIRERIMEYAANPDNLDKVAAAGAEKARASAATTMKEVRKLIGFR